MKKTLMVLILLVTPAFVNAETLRIATYNIEHFMRMFDQQKMPERSRNWTEYYRDREDIYEVAQVIKSADFNADIICIEECCDQEMLERFVRDSLNGAYEYIRVFKGNTDGQYLGMLARKGFRALDVREYADVKDPAGDKSLRRFKEREGVEFFDFLFCRGPAFVLFESPGGTKFWVGCTHVKSKYGNSEAVTKWRLREVDKTREICGELAAGPRSDKLVILGDFNDSVGMDKYEKRLDADVVLRMTEGKGSEKLEMLTRKLSDAGRASYHCKLKPPYQRAMLDHAFASEAMAKTLKSVEIVDIPIAAVASDHYPVVCEFQF